MTAILVRLRMASRSNSTRLPASSSDSAVTPVNMPPGLETLLTRPASTGSPLMLKTSGLSPDTVLAPNTIGPCATSRSTSSLSSSLASCALPLRSPERTSSSRSRPSVQPRSVRPFRKAANASGEADAPIAPTQPSHPMRAFGRCAKAGGKSSAQALPARSIRRWVRNTARWWLMAAVSMGQRGGADISQGAWLSQPPAWCGSTGSEVPEPRPRRDPCTMRAGRAARSMSTSTPRSPP